MANQYTVQIINDGPRNTVIKIEGILDTSDLGTVTVADPLTLAGIDNTGNLKAARFRIDSIQYNIKDPLSILLTWDSIIPIRIEQLSARGTLDYHRFGGLMDNSASGDNNGKITAASTGWAAGTPLAFSIVLFLIKIQ